MARLPDACVSDDPDQRSVPRAFLALYLDARSQRLTQPRAVVAARHELCEDMAQMLMQPAQDKRFALGIDEATVLQRMHQGLLADDTLLSPAEAQWVVRRLAELLDWPQPELV